MILDDLIRQVLDLARRVARLETQEFPGTVTALNVGSATGAGTGALFMSSDLDNIGPAATVGAQTPSGNILKLTGHYWNGASVAFYMGLQQVTIGAGSMRLDILNNGTGKSTFLDTGALGIGQTSLDANYYLQLPNDATKKSKANAWDTYASSLAWKRNVVPVSDALGKLAMLRGITYRHAPGRPMAGEQAIGIAAEELDSLNLPGLVTRDDKGEYSGINMTLLVPVLVQAVNEQQAQIASLRAEVAALKA